MNKLKAEWRKYNLGIALFASALLGGGPAPGPWSDTVLQILILATAAPVLAAPGAAIDRRVVWLCGAILAAIMVQLVPLPWFLPELFRADLLSAGRHECGGAISFISLGLGRTLDILLHAVVLIVLLLAMLRLSGPQLHALLPFFLAGVACNALAGLIQYSAASNAGLDGVLPFTMAAGFFANRNHFVSLLCTALPFLAYLATFAGTRIVSLAAIVLVLLVLLAAGSRAGVLLGLMALVLSVGFLALRSRASLAGMVGFMVLLGVYGLGTWTLIESRELTDLSRAQFAMTTLRGIGDNWLLGVGYGTFPIAYQIYESSAEIFRAYVNHAHNDYLELFFEGGVAAVLCIGAYFLLLGRQLLRVRFSHFHKAAFLAILFVLIHSTVDYPLRTMAVASAFLYFNAILFHAELLPRRRRDVPSVTVRHGRDVRRVPVESHA